MLNGKALRFTSTAYLILNMMLVITTLLCNFQFVHKSLEVLLIVFYMVISSVSIYYMTISGKSVLWLVTLSLALFMPTDWFFMLPMISLTLLAISSRYKTFTRLLLPLFLIILVIKLSLGSYNHYYDLIAEYERYTNEDESYALVTYMVDSGALGVDFPVYLEWEILKILKVEKRVDVLQGNNEIFWIDENTYSIDGKLTVINKNVFLYPLYEE